VGSAGRRRGFSRKGGPRWCSPPGGRRRCWRPPPSARPGVGGRWRYRRTWRTEARSRSWRGGPWIVSEGSTCGSTARCSWRWAVSRRCRSRRTGGWWRRTCWATCTGAYAVLPHMRERGSGVLINISSGFGLVGSPYQDSYTATKFAQRGLSQTLHGELRDTDIHVCTVMPGGVDTPAYLQAANYTGQVAHPAGPILSPEKVARVVLRCAEKPRPEVIVGNSVRAGAAARALARPRRARRGPRRRRGPLPGRSKRGQPLRTRPRAGEREGRLQRGGEASCRPRGAPSGRRSGSRSPSGLHRGGVVAEALVGPGRGPRTAGALGRDVRRDEVYAGDLELVRIAMHAHGAAFLRRCEVCGTYWE